MNGANVKGSKTEFRVWAPAANRIAVRLQLRDGSTQDIPMQRDSAGTFSLTAQAKAGDRYFYLVDDDPLQLPDPVSRYLPMGVHGPTEIVDPHAFHWTDQDWVGIDYSHYVIYELHVGTFTPEGTFDAVIEKLDYLKELGITAIELMPVAAFPGKRNWGYDGVSPYAVQERYGGPQGLKRLVDAAHCKGLAVLLDVVYNHLGSEGNYLSRFGPYFTSKHKTPWGKAINYDDAGCEGVRNHVIQNALYWVREYHIDGLRLDAVQTIKDDSPTHILAELRDAVQQFAAVTGRKVSLITETDENSSKYVLPREEGGYGFDGIWSDDFHHAIHTVFTSESEGYYQDFGREEQLLKALNEGFVFQGEMFRFWGRERGEKPEGISLPSHVICIQNHDQVGNRALGERLTALVPPGIRKLTAALLLLAPETPLIWMGQEYDEKNPFQFFTDYGDPKLQKAATEGRRAEFKQFASFGNDFPDPQDPATFERSKLNWQHTAEQQEMFDWYRQLLCLRRQLYSSGSSRTCCTTSDSPGTLRLEVPRDDPKLVLAASWTVIPLPEQEEEGWTEALCLEEPDCRLRVLVSPEWVETAKPLCPQLRV